MATRTVRADAGMVHRGWFKGSGVGVTGLTFRSSRYVASRFTKRRFTIMTASTASGDAGMVHRRAALEAAGVLMAGLAGRCSRDVRCWLGFNGREAAAVASRTACSNTTVIHGGRHEGGGAGVTGFALSRGWEVRR